MAEAELIKERLRKLEEIKKLGIDPYPYSFDVKSGNICLPLSDEQFMAFNMDMVRPESVLKLDLINRGLLERNIGSDGFKRLEGDLCG